MDYRPEELVPIVAKLAEKYTSKESTSITYEKAQQFMDAILYCLHEYETCPDNGLRTTTIIPVQKRYETGVKVIENKVREALKLYNTMLTYFSSYGNICLYDTVVKGIPEFFRWYDHIYEPQDTILTLDYPVLKDLSMYSGIDKIYEFLLCVDMEQRFLTKFPSTFILHALSTYDKRYKSMIDNVCEIVLMNIFLHLLSKNSLQQMQFDDADYQTVHKILQDRTVEELCTLFKDNIQLMLSTYFDEDNDMMSYLSLSMRNIVVRLKKLMPGGINL